MPVPLVAVSGAAKIVEGVAGVIGGIVGGKAKTPAQSAQQFSADIQRDFLAGKPGTLGNLQFRSSPAFPWMSDASARPIMLSLIAWAVNKGFAKASDFDPAIAQAAGLTRAPELQVPGAPVVDNGGKQNDTGKSVWLLVAVAVLVVAAAVWFLKR